MLAGIVIAGQSLNFGDLFDLALSGVLRLSAEGYASSTIRALVLNGIEDDDSVWLKVIDLGPYFAIEMQNNGGELLCRRSPDTEPDPSGPDFQFTVYQL